MAKRIQRKRTRGWRMPQNARYVGRPTKYGNPWIIEWDARTWQWVVRHATEDRIAGGFDRRESAIEASVQMYRVHLREHPEIVDAARRELVGWDLSCWCGPEFACHVDVLLPAANEVTANA